MSKHSAPRRRELESSEEDYSDENNTTYYQNIQEKVKRYFLETQLFNDCIFYHLLDSETEESLRKLGQKSCTKWGT